MTNHTPEIHGSDPAYIQWKIVRGDTAVLKVEFLNNDEVTPFDISDWEFAATTYDYKGDFLDELEVSVIDGYVEITAPAEITSLWGQGYKSVVLELPFDLQVTIDDEVIWTPVLGTIKVLADVTAGSL